MTIAEVQKLLDGHKHLGPDGKPFKPAACVTVIASQDEPKFALVTLADDTYASVWENHSTVGTAAEVEATLNAHEKNLANRQR